MTLNEDRCYLLDTVFKNENADAVLTAGAAELALGANPMLSNHLFL